jgi:asparagine synthase (glutamine-hydrolysing)
VLAAGAVREAQRAQDHGLPAAVAADWRRRIEGSDPLQAVSLLELSSYVGERLLRDTDAAGMAVALEVRVPLLDHVLVEAAAGIAPERRFSPPGRKQLLRDVALQGIDPAFFDRPKSGFVFPIDAWARNTLQPQMESVFAESGLARQVGLRGKPVHTLWRSFVAGRSGLYWTRVWALYVLMSWCREHAISMPDGGEEATPRRRAAAGARTAPRVAEPQAAVAMVDLVRPEA